MVDNNEKIPVIYNCSICQETYDVSKKKPFILDTCGHILCNSCMTCLKKLGENFCPSCKSSFKTISNTLPHLKKPETRAKTELEKIQKLKNNFSTRYIKEISQKSEYFSAIRSQVKSKAQEEISRICLNEEKILVQLNELEENFDSIFNSFSTYDRELVANINCWTPQVTDSNVDNNTVLIERIRKEAENLTNVTEKLKMVIKSLTINIQLIHFTFLVSTLCLLI